MTTKQLLVINGYDFGNGRVYGIHRNAMEIVSAMDSVLSETESSFETIVVVPEITEHTPQYNTISLVSLGCKHASRIDRIWWRSHVFPRYTAKVKGLGLDMTLALPRKGNYCVFDYDCIPERMPYYCYDSFTLLRQKHYKNRVKESLRNARVVFTDSEFAKSEIIDIYHIDPSVIVVVPCAWQHMLSVEQDNGILGRLGLENNKFFFALGSRYPYKNFRWIEAAARTNPQYRFVVTGSQVRVSSTNREDPPTNLTFTGYLSDEEVKALEAHCRAFLHPSLAEGFGIPPMEAMSVGAKCIVSNAASLPEIYGDSVWYIDPNDYSHIDLDDIMSQPLTGTNADVLSHYSWDNSARILLEALRGVGENS